MKVYQNWKEVLWDLPCYTLKLKINDDKLLISFGKSVILSPENQNKLSSEFIIM